MEDKIIMQLIAIAFASLVWGYMMFTNNPEIVKHRNSTQKVIYTVIWIGFVWFMLDPR